MTWKISLAGLVVGMVLFVFPSKSPAREMGDFVSLNGEIRLRYSNIDNFDLVKSTDDSKRNLSGRARLGADFTATPQIGGRIQIQEFYQFSQEVDWLPGTKKRQDFDLREGYLDFTGLFGGTLGLRAGRQVIVKGDQRIFGKSDWYTLGRVHDAVSLSWKPTPYQDWNLLLLDVSRQSYAKDPAIKANGFLGGLYGHLSLKPFDTIDPYYLYQRYDADTLTTWMNPGLPPQAGDSEIHTLGLLLKAQPVDRLGLVFEGNYQIGHFGEIDIRSAYMVHAGTSLETRLPVLESIGVSYDLFSGDKVRGNNESNTYQPVFPSSSDVIGHLGFYGMKNFSDLRASVSGNVLKGLSWKADYYKYWLDSSADDVYDAHGNFAVPSQPSSSKDLGWAVDFALSYKVNRNLSINSTYTFYRPGDLCFDVLKAVAEEVPDDIRIFTVEVEARF